MIGIAMRLVAKYICILNIGIWAFACTTDENSPAFNIPDTVAETALVEFSTTDASSPFYYRLLADQLIINWGDATRPDEYTRPNDQNNWSSIRSIEHTYRQAGTYEIDVRTLKPFSFNFSKNDSLPHNTISKLKLLHCYTLSELYCSEQPIVELDLTDCDNLRVLDIRLSSVSDLRLKTTTLLQTLYIDNTQISSLDAGSIPLVENLSVGNATQEQEIKNRRFLKSLKRLYLRGRISETNLNVLENDSLQYLSATDANVVQVDMRKLAQIDSISFVRCNQLELIYLESNPRIRRIELVDNPRLSAAALNTLFRSLPQTDAKGRYLKLSGNAGDEHCDRSIATRKGWIIE